MITGVVGLGLIGGSIAKAYKQAGWRVFGVDTDKSIENFAILSGAIDASLDNYSLKKCDLIHIAINPIGAVEFMKANAKEFQKKCVVIDNCGTKQRVCKAGFALAQENGYTYVGGHPMAGTHLSGFKNSNASLFTGASMIIVPPVQDNIELLEKIKKLLTPMGFKKIVLATADEHDRIIAFTSQLAHIISNAYIKSPTAIDHRGYSAGSFKDLTRVAWLNENMWSELFIENRKHLIKETRILIDNLEQYVKAMEENNTNRLKGLLKEGRIAKEISE